MIGMPCIADELKYLRCSAVQCFVVVVCVELCPDRCVGSCVFLCRRTRLGISGGEEVLNRQMHETAVSSLEVGFPPNLCVAC